MFILINDKDLLNRLKQNGPKFIKKYGFTKDKTIPLTIENYKRLLSKNN